MAKGNGETATEPGDSDSRPESESGKWVDEMPPAEALEKVPDKWGGRQSEQEGCRPLDRPGEPWERRTVP